MSKMVLDKKEVAIRQINQAIRMLFHKEDPVCVHLLVCSANNILYALMKKNEKPILLGYDGLLSKLYIKKEFQKEFNIKRHDAYNFFKHADKDCEKTIEFNPGLSNYFLLENIIFINQLGLKCTKEMLYFNFWLYSTKRKLFKRNKNLDELALQYNFTEEDFYENFDEFMSK